VAVEALGVGDFEAAEDELAPLDELMNIITDADMNHGRNISAVLASTKQFVGS
jgi:hypothetical protein